MKIILHKISSVLLAFLLVLSTVSFTVEKHFCGDDLVGVSFLGNGGCCEDKPEDKCLEVLVLEQDSCCKSELTYLEVQQEVKAIKEKNNSFKKVKSIAVLPVVFQFQFVDSLYEYIAGQYYTPPVIVLNIQILYEIFII